MKEKSKLSRLKKISLRENVTRPAVQEILKGSPAGLNERTLGNNSNPQEEAKSISKENYMGKCKRWCNCIFSI